MFGGLPIAIENPAGSYRYHKDGKTKMLFPYGFLKDSMGMDGQCVDCFLGPNKTAEEVYVVRQLKPDTGTYDEAKCMLGFNTEEDAKKAYLDHYPDEFFGGVTRYHMEAFRRAIKDSKHNPSAIKSKLIGLNRR